MAGSTITEIFVKCPKCEAVNRIVAAGLRDCELVSCSSCRAAIGEVGTLKLMAGSHDAGASRFPKQLSKEL